MRAERKTMTATPTPIPERIRIVWIRPSRRKRRATSTSNGISASRREDGPDPLTDRDTEILRLMASGFSNKEIANSLGVAEGTIKNHVSNILSKLGVRDRTRAVLKAFELQLV